MPDPAFADPDAPTSVISKVRMGAVTAASEHVPVNLVLRSDFATSGDHLDATSLRRRPSRCPTKDVEVIVYCVSPVCNASDRAANELNAMGYSNVRRYVGGKKDWIEAGLPVVREGEQKAAA